MKTKILLLTVFALTICGELYAQYEFSLAFDIQKNKENIIKSGNPIIKNLLNFLDKPFMTGTDPEAIMKEFDAFTKSVTAAETGADTRNSGFADIPIPSDILSGLSGAGLSESGIIYAVTDVLVERAKEEIASAFLDKLVEKMEKPVEINFDGIPSAFVLKDLFPNFYLFVKNIRLNMNMQAGSVLIAALEKDLKDFYTNTDEYLIPVEFKSKIPYTFVNTVYKIITGLNNGIHPSEILRKVRPIEISGKTNYAEHINNIAAGISESLLNKKEGGVWIPKSELIKLKADGLVYYVSLLYFNPANKASFDALGMKLENTGADKPDDIKRIAAVVVRAAGLLAGLQTGGEEAHSSYGDSKDQPKVAGGIAAADNILKIVNGIYTLDMVQNALKGKEEEKKLIKNGLGTAENLRDFYVSVENKKYGVAVLSVLSILNRYSGEKKINAEIVKYITLAADMCQAKDAESAGKIFEAAILPPGSYKLKRSSAFSVSISAYAGAAGGAEWLDKGNLRAAAYCSPFLPVGADFTWSDGNEEKQCNSHSVFISLIDLGIVAGYRFKNQGDENLKAENIPPVKFQHIIAPGIFCVFGLKELPLAFGAGVQFSPRLRAITNAQNIEVAKASGFRAIIFVSVDIPLFNIFAR